MRYCDLTFAYTASSGGIRTFLDQKRKHLLEHTDHEHVLIIPGEQDRVERHDRVVTYHLASPLIPGCEPYRFFCRPGALLNALREAAPDVIELGSFFVEPWTAFRYRQEITQRGGRCLVGGYFHTDLASAYFGTPVRSVLGGQLAPWSEHAAALGSKLGDLIQTGATSYFGTLFKRCDLMLAASAAQAGRLASYGVENARIVPLGVDLERFHPRRRSPETRARLGLHENTLLLIYAGRLDSEKRVEVLVDAFTQLQVPSASLLLVGEGPLRNDLEKRAAHTPGLHILPFQRDPDALADLLASADIYVTAGPHETFGLSVIEAQASGLPVAGVSAGALIERVPAGTGLLGPVDDATALARNIETIAQNARPWGTAARRHVEESGLGWTTTFERWLDAYASAWPSRNSADIAGQEAAITQTQPQD